MDEVFRRAANAYANATYEVAVCQVYANARNDTNPKGYRYYETELNLLVPARFKVTMSADGQCSFKPEHGKTKFQTSAVSRSWSNQAAAAAAASMVTGVGA
jgi:hypothetical protein